MKLALLAAAILPAMLLAADRAERIAPNDPRIQLSGRWDTKNAGPITTWSAATVRFRLSGAGCSAVVTTSGNDYLAVCIDGKFTTKIKLGKSQDPVVITDKLEPDEHEVELIKATDPSVGVTSCRSARKSWIRRVSETDQKTTQ